MGPSHEHAAAQHPAIFRRVVVCGTLAEVCASPDRDLMRNGIDLLTRASCEEMLVTLHQDAPDAVLVRAESASGNLASVIDVVHRWASIPVLVGLQQGEAGRTEAEQALDAGANALVTLPVTADELRRALSGLGFPAHTNTSAVQVGRLRVDTVAHRALMDNREVALTHREFTILHYLAARAPRLVPAGDIARQFSPQADPDAASRAVRVTIGSIRAKLALAADEGEAVIETVRGVGYRVTG